MGRPWHKAGGRAPLVHPPAEVKNTGAFHTHPEAWTAHSTERPRRVPLEPHLRQHWEPLPLATRRQDWPTAARPAVSGDPACGSHSLCCAPGREGGRRAGPGKGGARIFRALIGGNPGGGATWAERAPAPPSFLGCSLLRASCVVASSPASSRSERRLGAARSALPRLQPTTHVSLHLSGNCSCRDSQSSGAAAGAGHCLRLIHSLEAAFPL